MTVDFYPTENFKFEVPGGSLQTTPPTMPAISREITKRIWSLDRLAKVMIDAYRIYHLNIICTPVNINERANNSPWRPSPLG